MTAPNVKFPVFIFPNVVAVVTPPLPLAIVDAWFDFYRAWIRAWRVR